MRPLSLLKCFRAIPYSAVCFSPSELRAKFKSLPNSVVLRSFTSYLPTHLPPTRAPSPPTHPRTLTSPATEQQGCCVAAQLSECWTRVAMGRDADEGETVKSSESGVVGVWKFRGLPPPRQQLKMQPTYTDTGFSSPRTTTLYIQLQKINSSRNKCDKSCFIFLNMKLILSSRTPETTYWRRDLQTWHWEVLKFSTGQLFLTASQNSNGESQLPIAAPAVCFHGNLKLVTLFLLDLVDQTER